MKIGNSLNCLILLCAAMACAADEPPPIGNFAFPSSQQPGPLIGFGQNIIDNHETQLSLYANDFIGIDKYMVSATPAILYGVNDKFSIFLNTPIAASFKDDHTYSSGLEDAFLQLEYAFYVKKTQTFSDQATLVTNVAVPTGASNQQPPTGFGSPSFFLGSTFNRTYTDWVVFTSHGIVLTTPDQNTKFGNQVLYQAGFGRNIMNIGTQWLFAWIVEADGQYTEKNKINGVTDADSGGNIVYITPSLSINSRKLTVQPGVGIAVMQHLFGDQKKNTYLLALYLSWSFY